MKLFITKMFQFFVLLTIFGLSIPIAVNIWLNKKAEFVIPNVSELAVFGHSHPECAFNTELISNFSNFASSGESYFYTYLKAKELLSQNKQVETVFIEFSNDQINSNKNEWIWSDMHLSARYHTFSPFMRLKDHLLIFQNNKSGFLKYLHISTKKNLKRVKSNQFNYSKKLGRFRPLKDTTMVTYAEAQTLERSANFRSEISEANISYLKELIYYLQLENKRIFLIRSPLLKNNSFQKNEIQFNEILNNHFKSVEFLDFVNFPLHGSDFFDYGHLNVNGAEKFSKWFNELLEEDLLRKTNKQDFINERMVAYKNGFNIK